ncbi:MAG: hypothetical protein GY702_08460 [Desulfobulbaceae bacterium]|nr:hypothetical protein [Desulfobulbaceae bacterium]
MTTLCSLLFTSTCLGTCQALPPPSGNIVVVDSEIEIWNAVNSAISGDTILVADGTYNLGGAGYYLWIDVPGITIRSQSGSPEAVVFDDNYLGSEIITVLASNVTIANLTIKHARTHAIHVTSSASADTINTLIYNVRIIDPGQQAIKINPSNGSYFTDYGEIACSVIELTESGRTEVFDYNGSCYTGGVDGHQSRGWVVRDNTIEGFWCDDDLSEHGVHFWTGSRDTLVERNTFINNARGVGFGLQQNGTGRTYSDTPCPGATGHVGHFGGIIRNNFFFATDPSLFSSEYGADTGIALAQACGAQIIHNSLAFTSTPFNAIEYRFINTQAIIVNNLATHNILQRQDGSADLAGNLQYQPLTIFKNGTSGDLHISQTSTAAIDQGVSVGAGLCDDDIDGEPRPVGDTRDIGADEYVDSLVAEGDVNNDGLVNLKDAILSLRVIAGVDVTGGLTVKSDVSDDQKIGLEEAIFVLDEVSKQ